jgi:hypothetical protein
MNTIKVLGYTYTVQQKKPPEGIPSDSFGGCDFAGGTIYCSKEIPKDLQESTLLHEILEALNYHLELGLKHPQITALEAGLYQVLKDNGIISSDRLTFLTTSND